MDCQTAEGMVSRYIKHDLPLNELEEFLDHVQNCSSCYDELETYFIVHEVTHQLDDDSSDSVLDFKNCWNRTSGNPEDISARRKSAGLCLA
ncbi:MAG: zf-HC2 domain-containing protein [Blautia obeum]